MLAFRVLEKEGTTEIRTLDLLFTRQVLNQLSHGTLYEVSYTIGTGYKYETKSVVPNAGLEPMTLRLRVSCSTD